MNTPKTTLYPNGIPSAPSIGSASTLLRRAGGPINTEVANALDRLQEFVSNIEKILRNSTSKVTSIYVTDQTGGNTPVLISSGRITIKGHSATTILSNYVDPVISLTVCFQMKDNAGPQMIGTPQGIYSFDSANPPVVNALFGLNSGVAGTTLYLRSDDGAKSFRINSGNGGSRVIIDGSNGFTGSGGTIFKGGICVG